MASQESRGPSPQPGGAEAVKRVLLKGVFWRIFIIEAVLLVGSLAARYYFQGGTPAELAWYALRIIGLVAVILLFMMVTLGSFLHKRIINPLEAIARANRYLQDDDPRGRRVDLPPGAPDEIRQIAASRRQMLDAIMRVSEERLRLVNFIRETFGRYLSEKIVEQILESPDGLKLGGRRAEVTVLLSDLRGFSSIADTRDPEEIVRILNRFLERMSDIILDHGGVIDEFIGDAILAVFGVPEAGPDDEARAAACAIAMQNALSELNRELQAEGLPDLEMGVAVDSGSVVAGNIGSEKRLKYGIVGAVVNQVSRIESTTVGGQVLLGETAYERIKSLARVGEPQTAMMKGMHLPLTAYPLLALGPPYNLELRIREEEETPIDPPLEFTYWMLEGKTASRRAQRGEIIFLGPHVIGAVVQPPLKPLDNLKLRFRLPEPGGEVDEVYAKATRSVERGGRRASLLRVTSMHREHREAVIRYLKQISP